MVGLGGSVDRARALAVGLNCYLVIFCMYVFRGFHPTLGGAMVPALIIGPMVSSPCIGRNVRMGFYSHARYKFVLCALCVMIGLRVFSYFHLVLGGAVLPVAVDGRPWFLPCLWGVVWLGSVVYWFCIVYFGVDFIWGWWRRSFFPIGLGNTSSICYQFYSIYCNFKFVILFI